MILLIYLMDLIPFDQNKNGELVLRLETVEVVLVHCNLVNNSYQQASKVLLLLCLTNNLAN